MDVIEAIVDTTLQVHRLEITALQRANIVRTMRALRSDRAAAIEAAAHLLDMFRKNSHVGPKANG